MMCMHWWEFLLSLLVCLVFGTVSGGYLERVFTQRYPPAPDSTAPPIKRRNNRNRPA